MVIKLKLEPFFSSATLRLKHPFNNFSVIYEVSTNCTSLRFRPNPLVTTCWLLAYCTLAAQNGGTNVPPYLNYYYNALGLGRDGYNEFHMECKKWPHDLLSVGDFDKGRHVISLCNL